MNRTTSLKISISGVRGVVGESLSPQLVARFAQAFGTYSGRGDVVVGQDSRTSGLMVKKAVISGLLSVGCRPVDIGICPIPSIQIFAKQVKAIGGIAVTASHNPKEWNGLKFIGREGHFLNHHQVEEFLDIYHQGEFSFVTVDEYRMPEFEQSATETHLSRLLSYFDANLISGRRIKVVIDCGNGAGAVLAPRFLNALGCDAVLLNCVPDGKFAHQPEPVPENIAELCQKVAEHKADVGFVQDTDADRLAVVSEKGEPLGEEWTLLLAVKYVLSKNPGPVVVNLSTSRAMEDIARDYNVPVIRTRIGEINVVEQILALEGNAAIGGEGNGGVILPEIHPCRDSFAAMGLILEFMASSSKSISELQGEFPPYHMIKEKMEGTQEQAYHLIRKLRRKYAETCEISFLDGIMLQFDDHWVHLRPSNTEPVVRLIVEARSRERAEEVMNRWKKEIREMTGWK